MDNRLLIVIDKKGHHIKMCVICSVIDVDHFCFVSFSLFNGISTFVGYLMLKPFS